MYILACTQVRVVGDRVKLEDVVIKGVGMQQAVVEVRGRGSLVMERCRVEGGVGEGFTTLCGAVRVAGAGASLCVRQLVCASVQHAEQPAEWAGGA